MSPSILGSQTPEPGDGQQVHEGSHSTMSNEEIIRRLRAKGQPIRLFAESDKDRRLRLRALDLIEEKDRERLGGQNDFKKALEDVENTERELQSKGAKGKKKDGSQEPAADSILDLDLIKTDPDKLYPIIYYALKRILKEWGESMDERPGKQHWHLPSVHGLTCHSRSQAEQTGETRCSHPSPIRRVSQASFQATPVTSTFPHPCPYTAPLTTSPVTAQ